MSALGLHLATRTFKSWVRLGDGSRSSLFIAMAAACLRLFGSSSASSSVDDNDDAATALQAAVDKTLSVESFHAHTTFQEPSGRGPGTGTIDYQAPDREHDRFGRGAREHETITIGDT